MKRTTLYALSLVALLGYGCQKDISQTAMITPNLVAPNGLRIADSNRELAQLIGQTFDTNENQVRILGIDYVPVPVGYACKVRFAEGVEPHELVLLSQQTGHSYSAGKIVVHHSPDAKNAARTIIYCTSDSDRKPDYGTLTLTTRPDGRDHAPGVKVASSVGRVLHIRPVS